MGLFGSLFDFDGDGKSSLLEQLLAADAMGLFDDPPPEHEDEEDDIFEEDDLFEDDEDDLFADEENYDDDFGF